MRVRDCIKTSVNALFIYSTWNVVYSDDVVYIDGKVKSISSKTQNPENEKEYIIKLNDRTTLNVGYYEPVAVFWGIANEIQ